MASSLSPSQWGARTRQLTAVTGGELTPTQMRAARGRIADAIVNTPCTLSLAFGEFVPGRLHVKLAVRAFGRCHWDGSSHPAGSET